MGEQIRLERVEGCRDERLVGLDGETEITPLVAKAAEHGRLFHHLVIGLASNRVSENPELELGDTMASVRDELLTSVGALARERKLRRNLQKSNLTKGMPKKEKAPYFAN